MSQEVLSVKEEEDDIFLHAWNEHVHRANNYCWEGPAPLHTLNKKCL